MLIQVDMTDGFHRVSLTLSEVMKVTEPVSGNINSLKPPDASVYFHVEVAGRRRHGLSNHNLLCLPQQNLCVFFSAAETEPEPSESLLDECYSETEFVLMKKFSHKEKIMTF